MSIVVASASGVARADAVSVTPSPPADTAPNLLVTTFVGTSQLDDLEIYNQADSPIQLDGWSFSFTSRDGANCQDGRTATIQFPAGWLLAKHYFTFQRDASTDTPGAFSIDPSLFAGCNDSLQLSSIRLMNGANVEQEIAIPAGKLAPDKAAQHHQRNNSPNSTRKLSGTFDDDYRMKDAIDVVPLYNDPLYTPPADANGLQILEILPNARDCSPTDTDPTCGDYVKLYNPTNHVIDLAQYRLRVGHKGQAPSVANTFTWGQEVDPANDELDLPAHHYFTLATRNDDQPLSITNSGEYVWLEDAYGVQMYQPIVQYPDATSTTKVGYAWAYDGTLWRWTSAPQPGNANYFPPEPAKETAVTTATYKPCHTGQYRSETTHRCRTIVSANSLVPCKADQSRNPETNRCRSILASSAGLKSCKAGQVRNPATNRCKSTASSDSLKPCKSGWERNPDTHRCRKTSDVKGASISKVQDVKAPTAASGVRWLLIGFTILSVLAYALYEWRQELAAKFPTLKSTTTSWRRRKR